MMGRTQHLFVYGTLLGRLGHPLARLLAGNARRLGEGAFPGRLHDAGSYPAACADAGSKSLVRGEVYALWRPRLVLAALDRYEACAPGDPEPHLFTRQTLAIRLASGRRLAAWVYVYNRDAAGLPLIPSGDYAAHVLSGRVKRGASTSAHRPLSGVR